MAVVTPVLDTDYEIVQIQSGQSGQPEQTIVETQTGGKETENGGKETENGGEEIENGDEETKNGEETEIGTIGMKRKYVPYMILSYIILLTGQSLLGYYHWTNMGDINRKMSECDFNVNNASNACNIISEFMDDRIMETLIVNGILVFIYTFGIIDFSIRYFMKRVIDLLTLRILLMGIIYVALFFLMLTSALTFKVKSAFIDLKIQNGKDNYNSFMIPMVVFNIIFLTILILIERKIIINIMKTRSPLIAGIYRDDLV